MFDMKNNEVYVIDCVGGCECNSQFYHKDEIYTTKEEAQEELDKIKEHNSDAQIVTLHEKMIEISYWYY